MMRIKTDAGELTLTVKALAGVVAFLAATVPPLYWLATNMVFAADLEKVQQSAVRAVEQLRQDNLSDKVFELELVPVTKRTDAQRALLDRYKQQIETSQQQAQSSKGEKR